MLSLEELDSQDRGNRLRLFLADYSKDEILRRLYSAIDLEKDPRTSIIALAELVNLVEDIDELMPYLDSLSKLMPLEDSVEYYCFYLFHAIMKRLYHDIWVKRDTMSHLVTILHSIDMKLHLSIIAAWNLLKPQSNSSSMQWFLEYISTKKDIKERDKIPESLLWYSRYKIAISNGQLPELPEKTAIKSDSEKAMYYLATAEKEILSMPDSAKDWEFISTVLKKAKKNSAELERAIRLKIDTIKALADINIKDQDADAWNTELDELALRLSAFILKDSSIDNWVDFKYRLLEACRDKFRDDNILVYDSDLLSYVLLTLAKADSAIGNYEEALNSLAVLSMRSDLNPRFRLIVLAIASDCVVDFKTKLLLDEIISNLKADQLMSEYMREYLQEAGNKGLSKKYIHKKLPLKYKALFYVLRRLSSVRQYREGIVFNTLQLYLTNKERLGISLSVLDSLIENARALSSREEEDRKEIRPLIKALDKFMKRLSWAEGGMPSSMKSFLDTASVSYPLAKDKIPQFSRKWFDLWDRAIADDRARIRIDFYKGQRLIDSVRLADGFPLAILVYYEDRLKAVADRIEVYPEDFVSVEGIRSSINVAWAREFLNNLDKYLSMWAGSLSDSAEVEIDKLLWDAVNENSKIPAKNSSSKERIGYLPGDTSLNKFPMAAYLVRNGWLKLGEESRLLASDALISLADAHRGIRDYLLSCLSSYGYDLYEQNISSDRFVLIPGKPNRITVNYILWLGRDSNGQWVVKGVYNRSKYEEFVPSRIPKKKEITSKRENNSDRELQWPGSVVYNSSCHISLGGQDIYFSLPFRPKNRPQNKALVFVNWAKAVEKRALLFSYFVEGNRLFYTVVDPINYAFISYDTTIDAAIASKGYLMTLALKDKDRAVFYPSYQWWVEKHQLSLTSRGASQSIINAPGIRFMGRDEILYDDFDIYVQSCRIRINGDEFHLNPEKWIIHSISSPDGWNYYIYEMDRKPVRSYLIRKGLGIVDNLPLIMHLCVSRDKTSYLEFYKGGKLFSKIDSQVSLPREKSSISLNRLFPSLGFVTAKFKELHYPSQKGPNTEALFYISNYILSLPTWFSYKDEDFSDLVQGEKLSVLVRDYKEASIRARLLYYDDRKMENLPLLDFSIEEKDGIITFRSDVSYDKDIFLEGVEIKTTRKYKAHRLSLADFLNPASTSVVSRYRLQLDEDTKYFSVGSNITVNANNYLKTAIDSGIWRIYIETINKKKKEHRVIFYPRKEAIELGFMPGRIVAGSPKYSIRFLVDPNDKEYADVCWNGVCERINRRENLYLANYMDESLYNGLREIKKLDTRQKIYSFNIDKDKGVYLNVKILNVMWNKWLSKLVELSSDSVYLWHNRKDRKIYLVSKNLNIMTPILQYKFKFKEKKVYIKLPLSRQKEISRDLKDNLKITLSLDSLLSENHLEQIKENNGILPRLEYISALRLFIMIRHLSKDKDIKSILEDEREIYYIIARFLKRRYSNTRPNVFVIYTPAVRNWFEVENINKRTRGELSAYLERVLDVDPDVLEYAFSNFQTKNFITFIKKDEGIVLFPFIYFMFNLISKEKIKEVFRYNIKKYHKGDSGAYLSKIDQLLDYFSENDDLLDKYGFIYYFLQGIRPLVATVTGEMSYELKKDRGNATLAAVAVLPMAITMKQLGISLAVILSSALPIILVSVAILAGAAQVSRIIRNRKRMQFYSVDGYGETFILEEKYNIPHTIAVKIARFLYRLSLIYPDTVGDVRNIIERNRRFGDFAEDLAIYLLSNIGQAGKVIRDKLLLTPASNLSSHFRERLSDLSFKERFSPTVLYSVLRHSGLLGWVCAYSGIEITYNDLIAKTNFDFSMDKGSRLLFDMFTFNPKKGLKSIDLPGFARQFLSKLLAKKGRQFTKKLIVALEYLKELSYIYPEIRDSVLSAYMAFSSRFYPWARPLQPKERGLLPYGGIVLTEGERLWEK